MKSVGIRENGNGEKYIQARPWVVGFVAGTLLVLNLVGPITTFYVALVTAKSSIAEDYATKDEVKALASEFRVRFRGIESGVSRVAEDVAFLRGVAERRQTNARTGD